MSRQPAYSLIFAFVYMTVIMIVASTSIDGTNNSLFHQRSMEDSIQAQLAAQSAAELAIVSMKNFNAGYNVDLTEKSFCLYADGTLNTAEDGDCATWGNYTVYSSAMENTSDPSGYFYTPMPGTGTAGASDDCSILNDHEEVNHPCNWNKLRYGESVTIPLYTDDGSGGILTAADFFSFNGWQLKVRTPCADTEGQPTEYECNTRFTMNEDDSTGTFDSGGDSVIFWQLIGKSDTDGDGVGETLVSVLPNDEDFPGSFGSIIRDNDLNTEIYESLINDASWDDYVVLEATETSSAPFDEIYNKCVNPNLTELSLQLNIVTPLINDMGDPIPYLEWQMASDASDPFGDTKAVVIGEGYHQGAKGIFYFPFLVSRSTTGESLNIYTLSN